jgi:hypothetical protein
LPRALVEVDAVGGFEVGRECGFADLALGDFVRDVGAHEHATGEVVAVDGHDGLDHLGYEDWFLVDLVKVHSFDETDPPAVRIDDVADLLEQGREELVGQDEDEESGVSACDFEIWLGPNVGGQLDVGQVFDVFVFPVDDLGELLRLALVLHVLLEDPHVDLVLAEGEAEGVVSDHDGYGGTPVAGADNAYLFHWIGGDGGLGRIGCCDAHDAD